MMKEFSKMSSILWRRNRIWIVMIIALFLLSQSFIVSSEQRYFDSTIIDGIVSVDILEKLLNSEENVNFEEFQRRFYDEKKKKIETLKKNNPDGLPENIISEYEGKFKALADKVGFVTGQVDNQDSENSRRYYDYYGNPNSDSIKEFSKEELFYFENMLMDKVYRDNGFHKIDITKTIFSFDFGMILTIFILSFLLTSLEHLTHYYEFTKMLPWSNSKTFFSKISFGGLLTLFAFFASSALKYGLWKNSIYKNIIGFNAVIPQALYIISILLGLYFIIMSLGTVSGNIIGHIGMMIIGLFGIQLWIYNALNISYLILGDLLSNYWLFKFSNWISRLPEYVQVILTPGKILEHLTYNTNKLAAISFFVLSIAFLGLGWFWANNNKSERSGMLLMRKSVSMYAQVLAVITTASTIFLFFRELAGNRTAGMLSFGIGFLLSYLFYKKLFNVRIGI